MSRTRRVVSATILAGVLVAGIGAMALSAYRSSAAAGDLADTFTYKTVSSTTKTPHSYTVKSYGRYEYDSNGDSVADAVIDADDIRKLAAAVNDAQAIADAALN